VGWGVWCCLVGTDERRFEGKKVRADFAPFVSVLTVEDVHECVCVCNFNAVLMT
jgi:hypothetical protein